MSDLLTDPPEFGQDKTILAIKIAAALQRMAGTVNLEDILSDPPEVGHSFTTLMLKATAALQLIAENAGVLGSGEPLNVRNFGAVGDGVTDDTAEIQAALTAGSIYLPYTGSRYIISSALQCPSNRRIICEPGVEIFHSSKSLAKGESVMIEGDDLVVGNADIEIRGGIWDCNSPGLVRNDDETIGKWSGVCFLFKNGNNIKIRDLEIVDSLTFAAWLIACDNILIENVSLDFVYSPNADGPKICGPATNIILRNVNGTSQDDHGSICADDGNFALGALPTAGLAANDTFAHPTTPGVGGDITNVLVEGCSSLSRNSPFLRFLTATSSITGVRVRDCISVSTGGDGIHIGAQYAGCAGAGYIDDFVIDGCAITAPVGFNGITTSAAQGRLEILNSKFTQVGNGSGTHIAGYDGGTQTVRDTTIIAGCNFYKTNTTTNCTSIFFDGPNQHFIARDCQDIQTSGTPESIFLGLNGAQKQVTIDGCSKTAGGGWLLSITGQITADYNYTVSNCKGKSIQSLIKITSSNCYFSIVGNHLADSNGGLIHAINSTVLANIVGNNVHDTAGFIVISGGATGGRYNVSGNLLNGTVTNGGFWNIDASTGSVSLTGTDFAVTKSIFTPLVGDSVRETDHAFIYLGSSWVQIDN